MDSSLYPLVITINIQRTNKHYEGAKIEKTLYNELDYNSIINEHKSQNATITYRKAKWKDMKGKNFLLRSWLSLPKWAIAAISSFLTLVLSHVGKYILQWVQSLTHK